MVDTGNARHPDGREGAPRDALIRSGLALMGSKPWVRVSAKEIAESAGIDPALVTYYFGGRSGLIAAIARETFVMLRNRMTVQYAEKGDLDQALHAAVADPAAVLAREPLLAQLYVAELLLNGDPHTDEVLHDLGMPYFEEVQRALERSRQAVGLHGHHGGLMYTLVSITIFRWFLEPWFRRNPSVRGSQYDAEAFSWQLAEVVLHGVLGTGSTNGAPKPRRRKSKPQALGHSAVSHPTDVVPATVRAAFVEAALDMMREEPDADLTPHKVAEAVGYDTQLVAECFPDALSLMTEVARAAARILGKPTRTPRPRGRPTTQNPELEHRLVQAAIELIEENGKAVSARAVAGRAGCDPALVTYYFRGRRGLYQAVAAVVVTDLVAAYRAGAGAIPADAGSKQLRSGLTAVVKMVVDRPQLAQFLLDQFLVHGTAAADSALAALAEPYFAAVREAIELGCAADEFKEFDREILLYAIGALPVFLAAVRPILHRAFRGPADTLTPSEIADETVKLVLDGALSANFT
ncbi:TetR family transcriptional regulator [Rhodococcus sp. NPDC057014]|uniref:TetR family transcriptional regulator n=1 Tax=Rhodococcus sp. NPDC057014 TaxID=3346000 RepID=UPI003640D07C